MPTPTISATRLKTIAACERKYVGQYLFGMREEQGAGAKFGEDFHKAAEIYQLTGRVPAPESTIGKLLRQGTHFLRRPGSGALIEAEHRGELPDGTEWVAYIDASDAHAPVSFGQFRVDDQKTTSLAERALTDATLAADLQGGFYGWIPFQPHLYRLGEDQPWLEWDPAKIGHASVALVWNYFLTRGSAKAWQVRAFVKQADADRFLDTRVMPLVERIKALHSAFDAGQLRQLNDAERDLHGCDGVGTWCGAAAACDFNAGGLVALRRNKESKPMGLAELRAKYGQKNAPAAAPAAQPAPSAPAPEPEVVETVAEEPSIVEVSKVTGKPRGRRVAPPAAPPAPEGDRINPPEAVEALAEIRAEVANDNAALAAAPAGGSITLFDAIQQVRALLPPGTTVSIASVAA